MVLSISRSQHTVKVYGELHPERIPEVKEQLLQCLRQFGFAHVDLKEVEYLGYGTLEFIQPWIWKLLHEGKDIPLSGIKENPKNQELQ